MECLPPISKAEECNEDEPGVLIHCQGVNLYLRLGAVGKRFHLFILFICFELSLTKKVKKRPSREALRHKFDLKFHINSN